MNPLLSSAKRRLKQLPWLYRICLAIYVSRKTIPWALKHKHIPRLKQYILNTPWLFRLCMPIYFFLKNLAIMLLCMLSLRVLKARLKDKVRRRPHLLLYVRHCKTLMQGKIRLGMDGLAEQIAMDYHNWKIFRKDKLSAEKLERLYQEAILCCIKHGVHKWWTFLPSTKFNSVPTLHLFLLQCVLHRAGDYQEYIRLKNALIELTVPSQVDCYHAMALYYAKAIEEMTPALLPPGVNLAEMKRPFVIAFSVWGEHYLRMLTDYCLPSLMAEGNLPALCSERQPILFIHTNPEGERVLNQAPVMRQVKELGVIVVYRMLNDELIARFEEDSNFKYWHLGMVQSLDIYFTKSLDADHHVLLPDTIYSDQHFAGVLRAVASGHKVITRLGVSTCMETVCPAVEPYRQKSGAIAVPAADLAALSVSHVHSASWSWIVTNKDMSTELPNVYMLVWEGKDSLHMLSAHQTVLYVDREIMRRVPKRFYVTIDSELDKFIPKDCPIYCPKLKDAIFMIEVTPTMQRMRELTHNPLDEFARLFWYSTQESMESWRLFDEGIIDPLNRQMVPNRGYMTDQEIVAAKEAVKNGLLERFPITTVTQAHQGLELLHAAEDHPKAKFLKEVIEETAQHLQAIMEEEELQTGQAIAGWRNWRASRKSNSSVLERLYQEAILCCIRHNVEKWWNFIPNPKFNSVPVLQNFLVTCVLRRAGDYKEFLRIKDELRDLSVITTINNEFFDKLARYYAQVMEDIDAGLLTKEIRLDLTKRPFVIAFSVWGDHYLKLLTDWCLPSLLAEGNLGFLCRERQPVLFIHTNPEGKATIEQSESLHRIKAMGVTVIYRMINETLVEHFAQDPDFKYWHLGMVQSLDLYFAKALNADYHLLMPDTIYSDNHFAGLLKAAARGHKAIIRLILSTRMEGICPEVEAYRRDGVISIPAGDLAAFSVTHIHSASQPWIITHKNLDTEASNSHVVVWEGKDTLHMLSPHQTILYLDHAILQNMPPRFYMTLDSELEKVIPEDCAIYCPKPEDDICLIEMTSEKQRPTEQTKNPLREFSRRFWYGGAQESMAYWKIFNEELIDTMNRERLPDRRYMSAKEIAAAKQYIYDALLEAYPEITADQGRLALEILEAVQTHPQAAAMMDLINATIARIKAVNEKTFKASSAA